MVSLSHVLITHFETYPLMQIQDMVKLIYQHTFGSGHMIDNEVNALKRLGEEVATMQSSSPTRFELIGNGLCRMHLHPLDSGDLLQTLNRAFVMTSHSQQGNVSTFEAHLATFIQLCAEGKLPFPLSDSEAYLAGYKDAGYPAVSHSTIYRHHYHPHYRVVDKRFMQFYPLICEINTQLAEGLCIRVAIDGNSGSGKTTLTHFLTSLYDCNLFHMDDFFLPASEKTPSRLSEAGGNVAYERFDRDVIQPLLSGTPFSYQPFDCRTGTLLPPLAVVPKHLTIVEGVYSLHPSFAQHYTLKVFLYTDEKTQHERILARNGALMLERFKKEWIPLETHYFTTFHIADTCDYIIDTCDALTSTCTH